MPWQVLMLAQNMLAAALSLQTRKLSKHYNNAHYQVVAGVMSVVYLFGLSYAFFSHERLLFDSLSKFGLIFVLSGLAFLLSNVLTHRVHEHVDTAVGSLYSTLNIVGAVIAATLLINEGLTWHQLVGAALLLGAMALILSVHTTHKRHEQWFRALLLSVAAAVLFGLALTAEKYLLDNTNLATYIVFGWGAQWVWSVLFGVAVHRRKLLLFKHEKFMNNVLWAGGLRAGAGFLFMVALLQANNSSLVAVWSGLRVLLAASLAALILHERQFLTRKIEAALIALVAVAFLLW